ncbi:MAG: 4Fe-4S binding protein [bacterium]|nr:4Fe-4S binding protein [bacterium]
MKKHAYMLRTIAACLVLAVAASAFTGLAYSAKVLDLQIFSLVQRNIVSFSVYSAVLLAFIILLSFFGGRIYCSLICPLGIVQELAFRIGGKIKPLKRKGAYSKGNVWKYFIAAAFWGMMIGGSVFLARFIDPYASFGGAVTFAVSGIVLSVAAVVFSFVKDRFFCHSICPVGTLIGLLSSLSPFRLNMTEQCVSCGKCERECPASCVDSKGKSIDSERCLMCLSCVSSCPKGAISFGIKKSGGFQMERRELIAGISSAVVLGGGFFVGKALEKGSSSKKYEIILPAGAGDPARLLSKCMNCNLCVAACPSKIIKKADSSYGAVSIDLASGSCDYSCNACMEACPSGAIVRMPLEDKRKVRIAMAVIEKSDCISCGACASACPRNVISKGEKGFVIDGSGCIGCGSCRSKCPVGAIKMFPVKTQKSI